MPNKKIIDFAAAATLDGSEVAYVVQGGADRKASVTQIRAGLAASTHSHAAGDITGLAEAIDDRVAALLVAGDSVNLTYDDSANTLTIDAAGVGGGGGYFPRGW